MRKNKSLNISCSHGGLLAEAGVAASAAARTTTVEIVLIFDPVCIRLIVTH